MLTNIQSLRGLAAVSVVFVHIADVGLARDLPAAGRGGVDLFFVISGLIMVHIGSSRRLTPGRFLMQRIARVVPLYWLLTLLVFAVALAMPHWLGSTAASTPDLLRSLLFIPYVKANGLTQPMLFVGWTLNYEMFFYLLFAAGLAMPTLRMGTALVGSIMLILMLAGVATPVTTPISRFYTSPVLLEFLAGMALGLVLRGEARVPLSSSGQWILGSVAAVAVAILIGGQLLVAWREPVICGIPAVVLVFCALRLEQAGRRVTSGPVLLLGDASYSIYLAHPFVVQAVHHLMGDLQVTGPAEILLVALTVALVIAAGCACHVALERPLSRWTHAGLTRVQRLRCARPSRAMA